MAETAIDNTLLEKGLWESAQEAFSTMVNLPIQRADHSDLANRVGSITFTGPVKGVIYVECAGQAGEKITRSMLMMDESEPLESSAVQDAIGEVTNLVAGGFKARIIDSIGTIDISVPTVISGKAILPSPGLKGQVIKITASAGEQPVRLAAVIHLGN
ncbi:MAG: chemotaxis protein CheX [Phycisphaerae bacterium]|nr:chemotaxis protein CheX [Phycisphaerae bacterium]